MHSPYGILQFSPLKEFIIAYFSLRHRGHVGGQEQKISHLLLLFVHQQLYITLLLSLSLRHIITQVIRAFLLVLAYDLLEDRRTVDVTITKFSELSLILYYIKQIDSMLLCVCSVIDHRRRQTVVRTSVTHSAIASCANLFVN